MLTIRLQRVGKKNQPVFRIVLAEKHRAVKKNALEVLGHYNPRTKEFGIKNQERLNYWVKMHVEISPTVHNLLVDKGLLQEPKVKAWRPKVKKQEEPASQTPKSGEATAQTPATETKSEAPVDGAK